MLTRFQNEVAFNNFKAALPAIEQLISDQLNGGKWLSGSEHPMMVDYGIIPFAERFVLLENAPSPYNEAFVKLQIKELAPQLYAYVHRFRESAPRRRHCIKQEHWNRLLEYFTANPETKPMLAIDFVK